MNEDTDLNLEKASIAGPEITNTDLVKSWRTVVQRFCKSTTMHGVSRLVESTRWTFRVLWCLTVLTFICMLLWQAYLLVDEYNRNPSTTHIRLVTNSKLQFPAVTVCNLNRLRRSKLRGTRFEDLLNIDRLVAIHNLGLDERDDGEEDEDTEPSSNDGRRKRPKPKRPKHNRTITIIPIPTDPVKRLTSTGDPIPTLVDLNIASDQTTIVSAGNISFPQGAEVTPTPTTDDVEVELDRTGNRQKRNVVDKNLYTRNKHPARISQFRGHNDVPALAIPLIGSAAQSDHIDWASLLEQSQAEDYRDFIDAVNPSRKELQGLGHQAEDFILQCSFNQQHCDHSNFSSFQNTQYGNCFTFNRGETNKTLLVTGKTGSQYGLHLTLFTDESEYIGLLSHQSGVRVAIHQPNVRPFPEDDGITASTGTLTSIGLRQRNISRLGGKFGTCRDTTKPIDSSFLDGYHYSMRACLKACYQQKLRYECGCVSDVMANTTLCRTLDPLQDSCRHKVDEMAMENELLCNCPTPCREIDYNRFASFSTWPTDSADRHLKKKFHKRSRKAGNMTMDAAFRRKNMVRLEIFYENLNYESYKQVPKYTFEGLLGGIGGLMGFFAGMSLITVFEVTGFIVQLMGLLCGRLTTPIETIEGTPSETRISKMGRRFTHAFGHGNRQVDL